MTKTFGGWRVFLVSAIGALLSGCVSHFTVPSAEALLNPPPPLEEKWETTLHRPDFSREELKAGGVAILAVLTPGAPEGLRQNAAFEIFQGLRAHFPEVRVIPRSDVVQKIGEADRLPELNGFLKNYEERGTIEADLLRQWGEIEGVRYLFIGQIRSIDKHTEAPIIQTGERSPAGQVFVFSSGPVHIPEEVTKEISLSGELWDSRCGVAVWMGKSQTEVAEPVHTERVRVEDIFIAAGRNLTEALDQAVRAGKESGQAAGC